MTPFSGVAFLVPRPWRRRLAVTVEGLRVDIIHRRTGARLAAIDVDAATSPMTWVLADGNTVTRWRSLESAMFEASIPREGWAFRVQRVRAFFGGIPLCDLDSPHYADLVGFGGDAEIPGWPDDPRWRALFDSTVWDPKDLAAPKRRRVTCVRTGRRTAEVFCPDLPGATSRGALVAVLTRFGPRGRRWRASGLGAGPRVPDIEAPSKRRALAAVEAALQTDRSKW